MALLSLLQTLESDLIRRLSLAMDPIGVSVEAFPANPVDFELAPYRTQIFVSLQRRRFEPPEIIDSIRRDFSQRFTIEWGLQAELVNLSSHAGVYQVLDRCWMSLSGYAPSYEGDLANLRRIVTFEPLTCQQESFTSLDQGIYTYNQTWIQSVMVYSDLHRFLADVYIEPGIPDAELPTVIKEYQERLKEKGIVVPGKPYQPINNNPIVVETGLHRAKAGDLEDSVLDQTMDYTLPET